MATSGGGRTAFGLRSRRPALVGVALVITVSVLLSGALVWHASNAAFSGTTTNPANTWAAGTVSVSDDDNGATSFTATNLKPGATGTRCITVTYTGSLTAALVLYGTTSGALAPHLRWTVLEGHGGGFGSCTGFTPTSMPYGAMLDTFGATTTTFASGVGMFAPLRTGDQRTYQFRYEIDPAVPNSAQLTTASATFSWEARDAEYQPARTFGSNTWGQLGLGDSTNRTTPQPVGTENRWRTASAGDYHMCAVRDDGTLWCWGYNGDGELGLGDATTQITPTQVGTDTNWASVDAGGRFTCGVRTNGTLWCWGRNNYGQLGTGNTTARQSPVQIGADTTWNTVAAGGSHACGQRTDGTLWCWGYNGEGQLGTGNTTHQYSPVQVSGVTAVSMTAAKLHTCVVQTNSSLWCWGKNIFGQLGVADQTDRHTPTRVGTATTWALVNAHGEHTCAVTILGALWCWGVNNYGQLGQGDTTNRTAPVQVGTGDTWAVVQNGMNNTCAITRGRTLWCWGANDHGQAGLGDTTNRSTPSQTATNIRLVTTGWASTLYLPWAQ